MTYAWYSPFRVEGLPSLGDLETWVATSSIRLLALIALVPLSLAFGYRLHARPRRQRYLPGVPIVGGSDAASISQSRIRALHDSKSMLLEGYRKTNGGPFYYPSPSPLGDKLMLPVKYLEDLKTAPIKEVDFVGVFRDAFEGKYTGFGSRSPLLPHVVRGPLNKNLWTVMEHVQDEVKVAFDEVFPPCTDWTEVDITYRITQIIARLSSRMFGGIGLSRNREWTQAAIDYAHIGFAAAQGLKAYPEWLKPFAARFLVPAVKRLNSIKQTAERVIVPILQERAAAAATQQAEDKDLLCWIAEQAKGDEKDPRFLADIILQIGFAALHTSAAAPIQLLYDLCAMPEYIGPLRAEAQASIDHATHGPGSVRQGLQSLVKLDSIIKESQRFNPLLLTTFERLITKDFPLSDGLVIPKGTAIGVPAHAISQDPALYPEPEKFKGFCFVEDEEGKKEGARSMVWTAANPESLGFGYGRHACPGRFFAAAEIKAIMVYILLNYDFRFPDGQKERPANLLAEVQCLPNPAGRVMFKRRG
ncbi:Cytochrome P450 [Rhypophila decipiens]